MRDTAVVKALTTQREELNEALTRIDLALAAFGAAPKRTGRQAKRKVAAVKRRVMDAATREKIGKAVRRRWAVKRKAAKSKPSANS